MRFARVLSMFAGLSLLFGCGSSYDDVPLAQEGGAGATPSNDASLEGGAGQAGTGGSAGSSGIGGASGGAGSGAAGEGGTAGVGGIAGMGGTAGIGGASGTGAHDAGPDAAPDAPIDAAPDAAPDAGPDADPGCPTGFDNCDGLPGCEVATATDPAHCGSCNHDCGSPPHTVVSCANGTCVYQCNTNWGDCNAEPGCETDVSQSPANCGACGAACPDLPNAISICMYTCDFVCTTTYRDCDGLVPNGCEADIYTNLDNCGACGTVCPTPPHATRTCKASQCGFNCDAGWGNCDANTTTGCESHLLTDLSHCGACGNACGTAHAVPSCLSGTCSLACNTGWGDCDAWNGNGCETNLTNDADSCGACGHGCQGTACVNGLCQPSVVVTDSSTIEEFVLRSTHVYWAAGNHVSRAPLSGGTPVVLGTIASNARSLDLDSGNVYFVSAGATSALYRVPAHTGGTPTVVCNAGPWARGVMTLGSNVYWINDDAVMFTDKQFIAPTVLRAGQSYAFDLRGAGSTVFWARRQPDSSVNAVPSSGPIYVLATGQSRPLWLALDATDAYWATTTGGTVMRALQVSGNLTTLASGQTSPWGVAVDDTYVYWTSYTDKEVRKVAKTGGTPQRVTVTSGNPMQLEASATHLFWLEEGSNQIRRVVK